MLLNYGGSQIGSLTSTVMTYNMRTNFHWNDAAEAAKIRRRKRIKRMRFIRFLYMEI